MTYPEIQIAIDQLKNQLPFLTMQEKNERIQQLNEDLASVPFGSFGEEERFELQQQIDELM